MKITLYAICAIAMLFSGVGCTTEGSSGAAPSVVTIQYADPGRFTDFSIQGRDVQNSATVFTRQITQTLEPVMASRFPGYLLTLRFTNIDLAGRRASAGASSVRIVRNRTPARLAFVYLMQDKSGRTIASGSQRLTDNASLSRVRNPNRSGLVASESRMLQRWLQSLSVSGG
jgi:DUF3016 family protein